MHHIVKFKFKLKPQRFYSWIPNNAFTEHSFRKNRKIGILYLNLSKLKSQGTKFFQIVQFSG